MTYVNYLGCNHKLPIGDKYETEELGLIDESFFSDPAEGMENLRKHISLNIYTKLILMEGELFYSMEI